MKYKDIQREFTDVKLPEVWQKAVRIEKMAEILIYNIMFQCMDSLSDVTIELTSSNPINAVLRNWARDEEVGFGTNAISLTEKEDGGLILGCTYDIYRLRDDIEFLADYMFGSIDLDKVGDKVIEDDIEISDNELNSLFSCIQKKKVPLKKQNA